VAGYRLEKVVLITGPKINLWLLQQTLKEQHMSGLSALKFVATKRQQGSSPAQARRQKLSNKIHEQLQLARALQSGSDFRPVKLRRVMDDSTGELRQVEVPKRIKPWWWPSDSGKFCVTIRYGARALEVIEGKNAIETESLAGVITTLEVLREAVNAGELDARIEAVSGQVKAGFAKEDSITKRPKLKLPVKAS
jgi:hypothetical protein